MLIKPIFLMSAIILIAIGCTPHSLRTQNLKIQLMNGKERATFYVADKITAIQKQENHYELFFERHYLRAHKTQNAPFTLVGRLYGYPYRIVFPNTTFVPKTLKELGFIEFELKSADEGGWYSPWAFIVWQNRQLDVGLDKNISYKTWPDGSLFFWSTMGFAVLNTKDNTLKIFLENDNIRGNKTLSIVMDVLNERDVP